MKIQKEQSTVGAVAPSMNQRMTAGPQQKEDPKRKKGKRALMTVQRKEITPKQFKVTEQDVNKIVSRNVRNTIIDMLLEQSAPGAPLDSANEMWDNITAQINMSLKYARVFLSDGIKLDADGLKFSLTRTKAEVRRVTELCEDLNQLLSKIYSMKKKEYEKQAQTPQPVQAKPIASTATGAK